MRCFGAEIGSLISALHCISGSSSSSVLLMTLTGRISPIRVQLVYLIFARWRKIDANSCHEVKNCGEFSVEPVIILSKFLFHTTRTRPRRKCQKFQPQKLRHAATTNKQNHLSNFARHFLLLKQVEATISSVASRCCKYCKVFDGFYLMDILTRQFFFQFKKNWHFRGIFPPGQLWHF